MKFRHLVRFTRSRYFTVDYDVPAVKEGDVSSGDGRKRESKKSSTATNHYHLLIHLKKSTRLDRCC